MIEVFLEFIKQSDMLLFPLPPSVMQILLRIHISAFTLNVVGQKMY